MGRIQCRNWKGIFHHISSEEFGSCTSKSGIRRKKLKRLIAMLLLIVAVLVACIAALAGAATTDPNRVYYQYTGQAPWGKPATWVPIIMYHGITTKSDTFNVTQAQFVDQMEALKRYGFITITLDDYYKWLNGQYTMPVNPVIITFDDSRADSYYRADDVLKDLGFKATMFVITGNIDVDPFHLTWSELQIMNASGRWDLQAHGQHSHDDVGNGCYLVTKLAGEDDAQFAARVEADYTGCISDLQTHLGITPRFYAVPYGDFGYEESENPVPNSITMNWSLMQKYFQLGISPWGNMKSQNNKSGDRYDLARFGRVGGLTGAQLVKAIM